MDPNRPWIERLAYSIEVFDKPDGNLIEVLARINDVDMARAAFAVACEKHPDKFIVLALKAQVLSRSDGALPFRRGPS